MTRVADRRLIGFLALSIGLHALWLALPMRKHVVLPPMTPLVARIAPSPPVEKSAVVVRQVERGAALITVPDAAVVRRAAAVPEPARPTIDLDAAFASARNQGRETQARAAPDAPQPQLTVEAAVARATQRQALVETRGAAGEYVTINGNSRCVTPLVVPHFLEGKTMLTQCETRKG
jgi:hypothetical protein